ncbi:MAG: hypothetical protein NTU43_12875, partial [Bacteroidetes bacterium]|nr:hypothetical protein [Bacteroidota bacterium]
MKQKILILFAIGLLSNTVFAQQSQIVFQSDSNGKYSLWSVLDVQGASPVELTPLINAHAIQSGNNFGPINVSPDGKWYTFVSERFEADCSSLTGGNCLTVADFNFAHITSIRDGNGNVIHSTGVTSIFDGGNAIVYSDEGTHTLDVFIIRKISSSWTIPKMISGNSTYAYNINPRFSSDGKKVIFQGQSTAYTGESIMIVDSNGANLFEKINRNAKVDGSMGNPEVHMPSFAPDGSIIFEAQWGPGTPERVWHYSNLSTLLVMPDSTDLNDNSPVALPNGKVASLQLPNSTHDLKVENVDGSGKFFLTGLSTSFHQDVFDIGLGAGLANSFLTG